MLYDLLRLFSFNFSQCSTLQNLEGMLLRGNGIVRAEIFLFHSILLDSPMVGFSMVFISFEPGDGSDV